MKYFIANKKEGHSNLWKIIDNKLKIFSWIHEDWSDSTATDDILNGTSFTEITEEKAKELFPKAF